MTRLRSTSWLATMRRMTRNVAVVVSMRPPWSDADTSPTPTSYSGLIFCPLWKASKRTKKKVNHITLIKYITVITTFSSPAQILPPLIRCSSSASKAATKLPDRRETKFYLRFYPAALRQSPTTLTTTITTPSISSVWKTLCGYAEPKAVISTRRARKEVIRRCIS